MVAAGTAEVIIMIRSGRLCVSMTALAFLGLGACSMDEDADQVGERPPGGAVALVSRAPEATVLVFAAREYQDRLSEIADADRPPDEFPWISVSIPAAHAAGLASQEGLTVDLARSDVPVTVSQVYRDICNPALEDTSQCWLFERYTAGEAGLSGAISASTGDSTAAARFEIVWEGVTDRFGEPTQWHRHITSAGVHAQTEVSR
jgi:hypothetical protein